MADFYVLADSYNLRSTKLKLSGKQTLGNDYILAVNDPDILTQDLSFIGGQGPLIPCVFPNDPHWNIDELAFPWPCCTDCNKTMIFISQVDNHSSDSKRRLILLFCCASCDLDQLSSWRAMKIYSNCHRKEDNDSSKSSVKLFQDKPVGDSLITSVDTELNLMDSVNAMLAGLDAQLSVAPAPVIPENDTSNKNIDIPRGLVGLIPTESIKNYLKDSYWLSYDFGRGSDFNERGLDDEDNVDDDDENQSNKIDLNIDLNEIEIDPEDTDDEGLGEHDETHLANPYLTRWNELQFRFSSRIIGFYTNSGRCLLTGLEDLNNINTSVKLKPKCTRCGHDCVVEYQIFPTIFTHLNHKSISMPTVIVYVCGQDCIPKGRLETDAFIVVDEVVAILSTNTDIVKGPNEELTNSEF